MRFDTFMLDSVNLYRYFSSNLASSVVFFSPPSFIFTPFSSIPRLAFGNFKKINRILCSSIPFVSTGTTHYEFSDVSSEVELRLELRKEGVSPKEIFIDANENSLVIKVQNSGYLRTLLDTNRLYGMIKPSETIWYIDDDQLVVNLKKQDPELQWADIMKLWESLTAGVAQLLRGTSIYLVGKSTEINHKTARELAVGLGYTPLNTKEILESYSKEIIDSWVASQGCDVVAEAETAILESLSSHAQVVVSTLGRKHGAAERPNKWQHLFAGFTIWLSQSEATDEESAKEETRRHLQDGLQGYSNAEVVVKLGGWDTNYSKAVAQTSLSAIKHLILSDKNLPGKKSLYIRLGCRGDWPDIKPLGWDYFLCIEMVYSND
ncbi:probable inactive shikimate kinase like 2, chloroplastic [Olea europaea var. sylvestris]|uniref:probable inactive shikimate kinase like 2, chloroplastic n=1 Tax=Olea europaea var. sylvestris TaxID=158386 RepID=UPI000C1CE68A|nr:probable inactive shikimate kinase like 2, chloroplastic [Olea europaea var. sylvestris]